MIPGDHERTWWINLLASLLGGWWITTQAPGWMWWLPSAAALGILVAIAGDALTKQGVIVPFTWLTPGPERRIPGGPITTGGAAEIVLVVAAYAITLHCLYANVAELHAPGPAL